jgi:hypothetical protein
VVDRLSNGFWGWFGNGFAGELLSSLFGDDVSEACTRLRSGGWALLSRPVALAADDAAGCFHSAILACAADKRSDCAYHVIRHGYRTDTGSATRFRPFAELHVLNLQTASRDIRRYR